MVQVAGYVTEYEENDFKFVTVKGSGHMASSNVIIQLLPTVIVGWLDPIKTVGNRRMLRSNYFLLLLIGSNHPTIP